MRNSLLLLILVSGAYIWGYVMGLIRGRQVGIKIQSKEDMQTLRERDGSKND